MGNYDQLKNAVAAVIHDNGAEYITGDRLQDVLVTIINSVGAGATFAGVALPNTNPGTPDPKMFYLAGKAGTYTNFNVTITKGLWVFTNNGGTWTGTDLQVSMLFATGEDVTETSIAGDITQGASGDLPTVGAVRGALEAEDEKFFNEVAYGDIDDLATFDEAFAGSESGTPAYYTVYVMVNSHKVKVGTMEIISDNMAHVVTQVMVTHYVLDENGAITGAHADGDLFRIFRSKKIHGGTLPTDDWTPWSYVNETEWKKIVSGADAVPTPDSTNVVKSGGVAAAIENLEAADEAIQGTFFNEVAYEDLGNIKLYIDTLAGSQSGTPAYYTVYKAVGDDKVKVGTLQVISDSSRGVLTQILETHYTLDGSGNLSAVVDDDHTFRIARSVTYSGGLVSLWSPWSYVNETEWKKIVTDADDVPTAGSENLVKSGGVARVTDKIIYRSIFSPSATGEKVSLFDKVIKELYINPTLFGNADIDNVKICVAAIRKNVPSGGVDVWQVIIYKSINGGDYEGLITFNSASDKRKNALDFMQNAAYSSYCLVDWTSIEDGHYGKGTNEDYDDYLLDVSYVTDLDNFPISSGYAREKASDASLDTSIKNNAIRTVKHQEKYIGAYYGPNGVLNYNTTSIDWCATKLILLSQIGTTIDIVKAHDRWTSGEPNIPNIPYIVFFDNHYNFISGLYNESGTGEATFDITVDQIPSGAFYFAVNLHLDGYVKGIISDELLEDAVNRLNDLKTNTISTEQHNKYYVDIAGVIHEGTNTGWNLSDFIPISYFDTTNKYASVGTVVPSALIKLHGCKCRNSNRTGETLTFTIPYCLFYDTNKTLIDGSGIGDNLAPGIEKESDIVLAKGVIPQGAREIPDNAAYVLVNFSTGGYVEIPENESTDVKSAILDNCNLFRVSWIDDDFRIDDTATATQDARVVKEICDELGIRCDFAMIPERRHYKDEHGVDIPYVDINGNSTVHYPVNDDQYIDDAPVGEFVKKSIKQFAQEWQAEGFCFLLHPIHEGWKSNKYYQYQGVEFCHISLSKCMSAFDKAGIKYEDLLVYPDGDSHDDAFKTKMKQNVFSGVGSGHQSADLAGSDYNVGTCNPMTMQRLFIRADISTVAGKQKYKDAIDAAYAAGAWLIFGSHSWDFRDVADNSHGAWSDVKEVIEYANSLSHIRPVGEVLKERRILLGLYSG